MLVIPEGTRLTGRYCSFGASGNVSRAVSAEIARSIMCPIYTVDRQHDKKSGGEGQR